MPQVQPATDCLSTSPSSGLGHHPCPYAKDTRLQESMGGGAAGSRAIIRLISRRV